MTDLRDVPAARIGLRAYDITLGFRNLNDSSGRLTEFNHTHVAGMAALLAGAIRGSDVIPDARALRVIAAEVLKINQWAFDKVVYELECLGLVGNIRQSGGEIVSFDEYVPLAHDDMYERLGTHWRDSHPSEREGQLVLAVDTLADAPLLVETLRSETGIDFSGDDVLSTVGTHAELIHRYTLSDGSELVASPLYAFEQPNRLVTLFEQHPADRVREVFQRVREYPGFPVTIGRPRVGVSAIMEDMIGLGLASAPTVVGADGCKRGFIILPYGLDPAYLTSKKQILERALALIACVRCGQVSGGASSIKFPELILDRLSDASRHYTLGGHSSTARQYAPLIRLGVIRTIRRGDYLAAQLVPTEDNKEAVRLARTLLERHSAGPPERGNEGEAARLLFTGSDYLAPIETVALARRVLPSVPNSEVVQLWEQALGRSW